MTSKKLAKPSKICQGKRIDKKVQKFKLKTQEKRKKHPKCRKNAKNARFCPKIRNVLCEGVPVGRPNPTIVCTPIVTVMPATFAEI